VTHNNDNPRPLPPLGSYALTAQIMAECFPDDGVDWDAWKDEMKEAQFRKEDEQC